MQKPSNVPNTAHSLVPRYKMTAYPRGLCLIFNNKHFEGGLKTRDGTEKDKEKLKELFEYLRFHVRLYEDVSDTEMLKEISEAAREDHSSYDCFVCCILSHGNQGVVYGSNGVPVEIRKLTERLCPQSCPSLCGKPKVFIIQACQGNSVQTGYPEIQTDATVEHVRLVPSQSDFLLAYSTVPGYVSYRNAKNGSFFIQTLVELTKQHSHEFDFVKILTMVNHQVGSMNASGAKEALCKQSPAQFTTLRKDLFFSVVQLRLILLGKTGSGKSSSGNTILGIDKFRVCASFSSGTSTCDLGVMEKDGWRIEVTDTPGLCDIDMSVKIIMRELSNCATLTNPGPHAFLFLINGAVRFTQEEFMAYRQLINLFGLDFTKHMIIIFTHGDCFGESGEYFEHALRNIPDNVQLVLNDAGGRYILFNNRASWQERRKQSDKLLEMIGRLVTSHGGGYYSLEHLRIKEKKSFSLFNFF